MYSIHSIGQFHIGVFYSFYWTVSYRVYSIHSIGQFHIGVFYSFYWTVSYRCILFILLDSFI